jgi:hypothetical protein
MSYEDVKRSSFDPELEKHSQEGHYDSIVDVSSLSLSRTA